MVSSKFAHRRETRGTPTVCHTAPPPPILVPPPPPTCPPESISGYIDADWTIWPNEMHYYGTYVAIPITEGDPWGYHHAIIEAPGHDVHIVLNQAEGWFEITVEVYDELEIPAYFTSDQIPWPWCTHQSRTISSWHSVDPDGATCTVTLNW